MVNNDTLRTWISALAPLYNEKKEYLTELDSAIGDADHGINMSRGFSSVADELEAKQPKSMSETCKITAMSLIKHVGGASGPLYGTFFLKMSKSLAGKDEASMADMYDALYAGYNGLLERGKARPGDKTMLDVWFPVLEKMKACLDSGVTEAAAMLKDMTAVAKESMEGTIPMLAKKGRASYLGERSVGHQDPGATSSYYMIEAALQTW